MTTFTWLLARCWNAYRPRRHVCHALLRRLRPQHGRYPPHLSVCGLLSFPCDDGFGRLQEEVLPSDRDSGFLHSGQPTTTKSCTRWCGLHFFRFGPQRSSSSVNANHFNPHPLPFLLKQSCHFMPCAAERYYPTTPCRFD